MELREALATHPAILSEDALSPAKVVERAIGGRVVCVRGHLSATTNGKPINPNHGLSAARPAVRR